MRDNKYRGAHLIYVARHRLPWCPRGGVQKEQSEFQGPLCAKAVARGPHKKSVPLGPSLSRLSTSSGEPGCSQGKKRAFKPDSKLTTID
jgi:hypothetical protein